MYLPRLDPNPMAPFPPAEQARREPNGLLAYGGDLSPTRLMNAYRSGIFPWYSPADPILWWSPDPRAVFDTSALHLSRRLRRQMRRSEWTLHADRDFPSVLAACATTPRPNQDGTWILPEMQHAYEQLYRLGHAHSVEVYDGAQLVGGVYGVLAGPVFCGESMFSHKSGASTIALAALCRLLSEHGTHWLDAQMPTAHLITLGVRKIPRRDYLQLLLESDSGRLDEASWDTLSGTDGWLVSDLA